MVLEFYYDLFSQPCRAVFLFLKAAGVPFEPVEIELFKGEHHSPEFAKKNPYHKIPIIDDDGFILSESVAIMKYIADKHKLPDHWYPRTDPQKQARVNEYLHWQHACVRKPCVELFIMKFRSRIGIGRFTKQPYDEAQLQAGRDEVKKSVKHIADYFLQDKPYISGDEISAADILGVCELHHLLGVEEEALYKENKRVSEWMERVKERLQPHFDLACAKLMGLKERYIAAKE